MKNDGSKRVLVVDDDRDLLSLIALILEQEGYSVNTATDGREAINAVEKDMPNLVILDMKMPVMNGWEFAKEFHQKHDSRAPIVVLTAAADARRCAKEIGAVGWIGKPFELDTLLDIVQQHVGTP